MSNHLPQIFLIDINPIVIREFQNNFHNYDNVEIIHDTFEKFMVEYPEIDCIVSPANSFGCMDGGYDLSIRNHFGLELQSAVQKTLHEQFCGEQPVGTSIIIDIPGYTNKLIHTPTMQVPEPLIDVRTIYNCMRSTLICAMKNNIKTILIPAFGAATGKVPADLVAREMHRAYIQICRFTENNIEYTTWDNIYNELNTIFKTVNKS